jgi:hypothetical protein
LAPRPLDTPLATGDVSLILQQAARLFIVAGGGAERSFKL